METNEQNYLIQTYKRKILYKSVPHAAQPSYNHCPLHKMQVFSNRQTCLSIHILCSLAVNIGVNNTY